jgi:hypothetical protein
MSIINDALKKTQKAVPSVKAAALGGNGTPAPDSGKNPETAPPRPVRKILYLLSAALLLLAGGAAFLLARRLDAFGPILRHPERAVSSVHTPNNQAKSPAPEFLSASSAKTDRPASTGRPLNPGSLVLNGTMMRGDHRVALINSNIYQIGDKVEEYEILEITLQAVKLRKNNEIVFIKTRNY